MRALWLINQLCVIVPVNPLKNRASSWDVGKTLEEFVNTRQGLVVYKFFSCSTNIPRGLSAHNT